MGVTVRVKNVGLTMNMNFYILVISNVADNCALHHSHSLFVNNFILNNPLIISANKQSKVCDIGKSRTKGLPDDMIFQILEQYT